MVSAWATSAGLALAQRQAAEGSDEIAAAPEMLQQSALTGCIVTADAAHCQTKNARLVVERGGDYVFALKDNHGRLYEEVTAMVAHEAPRKYKAVKHERGSSARLGWLNACVASATELSGGWRSS